MINKSKYINYTKEDLNNEFILACSTGNFKVVKYLLNSPKIKEHADIHTMKDFGFKIASKYNHFNIIEFLIFEMNINKTKDIEDFLKNNPNRQVENMFELRELNKKLEKDLNSDKIKNKKLKV